MALLIVYRDHRITFSLRHTCKLFWYIVACNFQTIFCNVLYWINSLLYLYAKFHRITFDVQDRANEAITAVSESFGTTDLYLREIFTFGSSFRQRAAFGLETVEPEQLPRGLPSSSSSAARTLLLFLPTASLWTIACQGNITSCREERKEVLWQSILDR